MDFIKKVLSTLTTSESLCYGGICAGGIATYMTTDLAAVSMTGSAILGAFIMQMVKRYSW